jgi:hypothetical protein
MKNKVKILAYAILVSFRNGSNPASDENQKFLKAA